jgi:lipopolysaccharide biosynthesis regulator YciM
VNRIATVILLTVVAAFSYFAFYNQDVVSLKLWKGQIMDLPVVGVVLISMGIGAAVVFLLFALRGIRRTYDQIQTGIVNRRRLKAEDLYNRGVDAHLSGKMEKAVKLLEDAVSKDPEYLQPFFRLGTVYMQLGQGKKALELHRKALEAHPENLRILLYLVDDYRAIGDLDEAAGVLRKIISKDDTNRSALEALRDIQEKKGDWRGAVESQSRLIKVTGKDDDTVQRLRGLRYQWAVDLLAQGEGDRGIRTLKEILKEDSEYMAAVVTLGEAYMRAEKLEEGIKVLSEGYRHHQNPVFLQVMEKKLIKHDNPSRLVKMFRKLLVQSPEDVLLNLFYGKICLRLEMIDEGYMALRKVESMGYESALLHALLGEINTRRERYEEAIKEYQRYVEMSDGLSPRFVCGNCGNVSEKWNARCESCSLWNSYALPGLAEPARAPAVRPQYDTEEFDE